MSFLPSPLADLARAVAANWDMVRDPDRWAPMTIGRYHLDFELGRGAFGVVFSGFDPAIERDVAIKVFYAPDSSSDHARREARMLAGLCHPNIVKVIDSGCINDFYYLSMEMIEGTTLSRLIAEGKVKARKKPVRDLYFLWGQIKLLRRDGSAAVQRMISSLPS